MTNTTQNQKIYVTMTDQFLSGWGQADGTKAKYVYVCDNWQQAENVKRNAEKRDDQTQINISHSNPLYRYKRKGYHVRVIKPDNESYKQWYKKPAA